jgi:hypothetical protein
MTLSHTSKQIFKLASILFFNLFFMQGLLAQSKSWGKLQIDLPGGWSSSIRDGVFSLSNYNIKDADPYSIILFGITPYTGKMDTLFAHVWSQKIGNGSEAAPIPRWRKFYTNDGMLIQQGFHETNENGETVYRQLNIFLMDGAFQACIINAKSLKSYRTVQSEWQDRIVAVRSSGKKN